MYLTKIKSKAKNGKTYSGLLLRESYRVGKKVKTRTIANLKGMPDYMINSVKLSLEKKKDLSFFESLKGVKVTNGKSVGALWTIYKVAKKKGITEALGNSFESKLALWQVIARVMEQGSRLSSVRTAQIHETASVLNLDRGFDENDLYSNLKWIHDNQEKIEDKLFKIRKGNDSPKLFLYDVTSSYLEGTQNELANFGYNRDGKKGKQQIVIGMMCDEKGEPVSVEVFAGNTNDTKTFNNQILKVAERFNCKEVTFVGDRGMIKSGQIEDLEKTGFHYITALTRKQIETLEKKGLWQPSLFEDEICEIEDEGIRYILRRNPVRQAEIEETRNQKQLKINSLIEKENTYIAEHKKAKIENAKKRIEKKIEQLKMTKWLSVESQERVLGLSTNENALEEISQYDGCYVIKTDLSKEKISTQETHQRYKDLGLVESAFRTCKLSHLEVRPIYVRSEPSTRGHVLVVMLAYMIVRELQKAWKKLDVRVTEGLEILKTICTVKLEAEGKGCFNKIEKPNEMSEDLLKALDVRLPEVLPAIDVPVVTRKKLSKKA